MSKALMNRRDLIKRLGYASFLAVPVFRPSLAEAQAAPRRLIILSFPGGTRTPGHFSFGSYLAPLAPYQSDILLFQNMRDPTVPEAAGHGAEQCLLTGNGGANGMGGETGIKRVPGLVSVDQLVAQAIGGKTRFSSLQFAVQSDQPPSGDDPATLARIVYSNGNPVAPIQDPQAMFTRLFMGAAPATPPPSGGPATVDPQAIAKAQAIANQRKSLLDLLKGQVTTIKGVVGAAEKQRLDEHLTALRELEKSIPAVPADGSGTTPTTGGGPAPVAGASCKTPTLGSKIPITDIPAVGAAMNEMLYQAINCDLSRVATLQWLNTQQAFVFSWAGATKGHHTAQHEPGPDLDKCVTWLMSQVAVLVKRLKETSEGGGSMLDNCLVFVSSEMGDGQLHDSRKYVPALIAGKAGGAVRPGRTLDVNGGSRNNLLMSIGNAMGLNLKTIGEAQFCTAPYALT